MKYFSMFSGIGGFEFGIQRAYCSNRESLSEQARSREHIRCEGNKPDNKMQRAKTKQEEYMPQNIGYSEIDKYAIQIYEKHFKGHKNYGNCTTIKWQDVPNFDLLVGGFPCQSFSIAGKRGGFNDTRGTLFFEIVRCIREKQPRLFLLENVKGLLSHNKGNTFFTIITTLDELGYDLQWQVLNSKNFGVPQNRERVFIIGHLRGTSRPEVFPIGNSSSKVIRKIMNEGGNHQGGGVFDKDGLCPSITSGGTGGATNNCPKIPLDAQIRRLTPTECERLQGFPDGWTEGISDTQRYKCLGNAVTVNVIQAIMEKL